jgi:hypothetical protein
MAKQNPSEPIDPVCKYIDEQVKPIRKQLDESEDSLLETQRLLARFFIHFTADNIRQTVGRRGSETLRKFSDQLVIDADYARLQTNTSDKPLVVAHNFAKKNYDEAEKLGIKFINIH